MVVHDVKALEIMILHRYEARIYKEWTNGVEEACNFNLGQPLIKRCSQSDTISVNFDPQVSHNFCQLVTELMKWFAVGKEIMKKITRQPGRHFYRCPAFRP